MDGDIPGAVAEFEAVVGAAPADAIDESTAKAHYSLGVLAMSQGRTTEGVSHLRAAVKYQPTYGEAHLALADALRRAGNPADALAHYNEAMAINPTSTPARFGQVMALVRLKRYRDARESLTDGISREPDARELKLALARVLAAAPDAAVRDGSRALDLVQALLPRDKGLDVGETLAMALAEVGQFDRAAGVQRGVMEAAVRAGRTAAARGMERNLQLYLHRQPCRMPWRDDDPLYSGEARLTADSASPAVQ
jgi:tetratricopeptide (TPR) repeat protein